MDTEWCLRCSKRISGSKPYCSQHCFALDQPEHASSSAAPPAPRVLPSDCDAVPEDLFLADDSDRSVVIDVADAQSPIEWHGKGDAGIRAWARAVPAGPPVSVPTPPSRVNSISTRCSSPLASPPQPPSKARPRVVKTISTPKLLHAQRRPMPPTLCMSTPQPERPCPSLPVTTPQQHMEALAHAARSYCEPSSTAPSSPCPTTPPVDPRSSVFDTFATQVRSWCAPSPHLHDRKSMKAARLSDAQTTSKSSTERPFTVIATHHPTAPLPLPSSVPPYDDSSDSLGSASSSVPDSLLDDMDWIASSSKPIHRGSAAEKEEEFIDPDGSQRPWSRRLAFPLGHHLAPQLSVQEHPAFRNRGRKPSRAVA
ncbi:hypothetical protein PLICRDRAFT_56274 [Plicaturopsis crispa FD-325 SS-3]|nr:hypothetical protein PLICRDRAFT_56274 [Plicaturopsis crispa FD-325 SS-3]